MSRAKPRATTIDRRHHGRVPGAKNWSLPNTHTLLAVVKQNLPRGGDEWEKVASDMKEATEGEESDATRCKNRFRDLVKPKKRTGTSGPKLVEVEAAMIARMIEDRNEELELGGLADPSPAALASDEVVEIAQPPLPSVLPSFSESSQSYDSVEAPSQESSGDAASGTQATAPIAPPPVHVYQGPPTPSTYMLTPNTLVASKRKAREDSLTEAAARGDAMLASVMSNQNALLQSLSEAQKQSAVVAQQSTMFLANSLERQTQMLMEMFSTLHEAKRPRKQSGSDSVQPPVSGSSADADILQ